MKILAICGFGIGSSVILKIKLEEVFTQLGKNAFIEVSDITSASGKTADLYVTSPGFASQLDVSPLVIIQNFMNTSEIHEKISSFLDKD